MAAGSSLPLEFRPRSVLGAAISSGSTSFRISSVARAGPIRWLVLGGLLLIAAIAIGAALMAGNFRERALQNSEREVANTVLLLTRHFDQQLEDLGIIQHDLVEFIRSNGIATPEDYKAAVKERVLGRLKWVDSQLEGKAYLMGDDFCVADAYLFTVTSWTKFVGIDISGLTHLGAFMGRMAARPAVQDALKAEGLLK